MKKLMLLFVVLLTLSGIVYGLDECTGVIETSDVPCSIFLPVDETTTCTDINVSFYTNTTQLFNTSMATWSTFLCNVTFNISEIGSYVFHYTTGDSGSIIVEGGNTMELLIYFAMILTLATLVLGLYMHDRAISSLGAVLSIITGVFIMIYGFADLSNMLTLAIAIIFWGIGAYVFVMSNVDVFANILDNM